MNNNSLFDFNYIKYKLNNGLDVILYQDKSLPTVVVNIWYRVGSANETQGKTGFAHLFEHMMFQGSKHIPKEGHFHYIQEAGGTLNGSTSHDRTNYYEALPSNYLELALWLESDRMGFLLPALTQEKLDNQKEVVMNERRQRYENQPYGLSWELLFSNLYSENHPYHWPTIGWMRDIEKFKLDDVRNFFKKYYAPNNASLVIGGNFEIEEAKDLVHKFFDEIPAGEKVNSVISPEQKLNNSKVITHEDNVQLSRIYLAWHTVKIFDEDDSAIDLLSEILTGGKNSRLNKSLVFEKQIAQDVNAFQYNGKLGGNFIIISTAKPDVKIENLKDEIFSEIEHLIDYGITDEELIKTKNQIKSSFIYSLQKLNNVVDYLNFYNFHLNEPNYFQNDLNELEKISKEDVINVAKKYLSQNYIQLNIIPKK